MRRKEEEKKKKKKINVSLQLDNIFYTVLLQFPPREHWATLDIAMETERIFRRSVEYREIMSNAGMLVMTLTTSFSGKCDPPAKKTTFNNIKKSAAANATIKIGICICTTLPPWAGCDTSSIF